MGNPVLLKVTQEAPISFTHENCDAQLAALDWTNAS